jgi:flagellar biosynthetic protein FliR
MLVVELATGLVAKAAPALNLMVVGTPVRLVVGLLAVAVLVPQIPGLTTRFVTAALEAGRALAQAFR